MVNNIRDIQTDSVANKHTLAVLIGRRQSRTLFALTLVLAYLATAALWLVASFDVWVFLAWLSLPFTAAPLRAVLYSEDGPTLNTALQSTARLHLLLGLLLALGLAL